MKAILIEEPGDESCMRLGEVSVSKRCQNAAKRCRDVWQDSVAQRIGARCKQAMDPHAFRDARKIHPCTHIRNE